MTLIFDHLEVSENELLAKDYHNVHTIRNKLRIYTCTKGNRKSIVSPILCGRYHYTKEKIICLRVVVLGYDFFDATSTFGFEPKYAVLEQKKGECSQVLTVCAIISKSAKLNQGNVDTLIHQHFILLLISSLFTKHTIKIKA